MSSITSIAPVCSQFASGIFGALTESDSETLSSTLNDTKRREAWSDYSKLAPKLDQANLRLRAQDIDHIVEWHDRLWPVSEDPPDEQRPIIGFRRPDGET